jgi:hypothetical protein
MTTSLLFRRAAALVAVLSLAGAAATFAACLSFDSYVYTAEKYDPTADCVEEYAPVEVIKGSGAGAFCPPTCLTVGRDLYVTTMCPPLPTIATAVAADASDCIAARAAAAKGTCNTVEAGATDAGEEAGKEEAGTQEDAATVDDAAGE